VGVAKSEDLGEFPRPNQADPDHARGITQILVAYWLRHYAFKIALALTGIVFGVLRRDILLVLLGAGFLLQPIGKALTLSDFTPKTKKIGHRIVRVGRAAFFVLCVAVLVREMSKLSLGGR
jgi:hypothetical protein